jgi:hypothetical protein
MKIRNMLWLCAGGALAAPVLADEPMSGHVLGMVQGTVDFCAKLNPAQAANYQEQSRRLLQGVPADELTRARSTEDYKIAYERTSTQFKSMPEERAAQSCKGVLEEGKNG